MDTTAGDVRNANFLYLYAHTCTFLVCVLCAAVSQVKITAGGKTDQTEPHKKTYRTSFTKKFIWDDADSVSEMVVDVFDGLNTFGDQFIGDSHSHILRSKSCCRRQPTLIQWRPRAGHRESNGPCVT